MSSNSGSFGLPTDERNLRLLENVRPASWVNPEPKSRYHLVVIGAGTAGLVCAAEAAAMGARVALIERHLMGGDRLNVACVPSKSVVRAARAWQAVTTGKPSFAAAGSIGTGDFAEVMGRTRELRARLSAKDSAARYRDLGVDVFVGDGHFVGPDAVEVAGQRLSFRNAVIATGGRAAPPPIPGLAGAGYLTNETLFNLSELPRRLAVIGAGSVGCELAQAFARFGAHVALFDSGTLLPLDDPDAAALVRAALESDGVRIELGVKIVEVAPRGRDGRDKVIRFDRGGIGTQADEFVANEILVAVGRKPNIEALRLEAAGVTYSAQGVTVDDRLRTSNPKIFAAGDVCSAYQLTHNSAAQARIVISNALLAGGAKASQLVMPWCTYTSPEVAHVGLDEPQAKARGIALDTVTTPLADIDRAVLDGEERGFLRLHLKKGTDRILGATLVAEHAGDMIAGVCLAVAQGVGLEKIAATLLPYPTQGEVLKKTAEDWTSAHVTPFKRRLRRLRLWFRK